MSLSEPDENSFRSNKKKQLVHPSQGISVIFRTPPEAKYRTKRRHTAHIGASKGTSVEPTEKLGKT